MDEARTDELHVKNLVAWDGELFEPKAADSSLKKNSAFVKKLAKGISKTAYEATLKEMAQLSLKKYPGELLLATQEGLLKTKSVDAAAAVEVVSALHQRFCPDFTPLLLTWFLYQLESPGPDAEAKDEKEYVSRAKVLLRLLTMFNIVGIFRTFDDTRDVPNWAASRKRTSSSLLVVCLKEILTYKHTTGASLTVATTFTKRFPELVTNDAAVRQVLTVYTEAVVASAKTLHQKVKELAFKKHKAQIRTGRILEELETEFDEKTERFENFKTAAETLGPVFGIEVPPLEPEILEIDASDSIIITTDAAFQNEEEKRFYQTFPDIPQELIDESNAEQSDVSRAQEMNDFLIKLEITKTPKDVDECVMEFWKLKLSNKASKNRLVRHFITSKELGHCKNYARFLRTCAPRLDDVKEELLTNLDQGFRSQIHHNGVNFKNIVFFCEMVKFELVPEHVTFHKIRSLIMSLATPNNIEILSIFFEFCGKYLLNEHRTLMEEMLVLLEKKRKTDKLSISNKMQISNLFLLLKPPSIKSLQSNKKQYTPEQLFLKELVRHQLNASNVKQVRKILTTAVDMTDPLLRETVHSLFTKPDKLNYENIVPLAQVLKTMPRNFKVIVVDTVLEDIIRGMEVNDYRYNRIRMAQCFYISQIYEHGIIGGMVIHDLVFKILTFGHPNNSPNPIKHAELDQPDEYFRVQMAAIILLTCTLKAVKIQNKLDVLLHFFDYYIWIKDQPIPKETDFKVRNCFAKYNYTRAAGPKEAIESLHDVVSAKGLNGAGEEEDEDDEVEDEDGDDYDDDDDDDEDDGEDEDYDDDDDDSEDSDDGNENMLDADFSARLSINSHGTEEPAEEDDEKLTYEAYEKKLREEEEKRIEEQLEKEFKKMVFDSMHSQKTTKTVIELPQSVNVSAPLSEASENKGIATTGGKVAFKLVTRKGKTLATKDLNVPKDIRLATNVVEEEKRTRLEKEQLTKFILNTRYDDN